MTWTVCYSNEIWCLRHVHVVLTHNNITDLQSGDVIFSLGQFSQRRASPPQLCDLLLQLSDHEFSLVLCWTTVYLSHFQQPGLTALQRAYHSSKQLHAALHFMLWQPLEHRGKQKQGWWKVFIIYLDLRVMKNPDTVTKCPAWYH